MYERFTDRARKVIQLANQEAQRLGHEYLATEHLLLGLVKEGSGVAATVLKNLALDFLKVRQEVERVVEGRPVADNALHGRLPQTPRVKKVIEYAIEESRHLGHNYVGTEHLLLGLVRETEGVAVQVLTGLGLTPDRVRGEALRLLGHPIPGRGGLAAETVPVGDPPAEPAATVLDRHIDWLRELIERAVRERNLELAASVLEQLGEIRVLRDRLA